MPSKEELLAAAEAFATMPKEQQEHTPAGILPPGTSIDFDVPPTLGYTLLKVGGFLLTVMLICAILRFYTVIAIRKKINPDDVTTFIASIGACCYYTSLCFAVIKAKFGSHLYNLSVAHISSDVFIICSFFTNAPNNIFWAFAKSSFLLMYIQIFNPLVWVRYSSYAVLSLVWGFYISMLICQMYFTAPSPGMTWQESFGTEKYYRTFDVVMPLCTIGFTLDVVIFVLPMAAVYNLQLNTRKKVGVLVLFATGGVAVIASGLNIYFNDRLMKHYEDYTYYVVPVQLMFLVEMCVGVSASCMPVLARFFKEYKKDIKSASSHLATRFRTKNSGNSGSQKTTTTSKSSNKWSARNSPFRTGYTNMLESHNSLELDLIPPNQSSVRPSVRTEDADSSVGADGIYVDYTIHQNTSGSSRV